ncbi:hypothetical protein DWX98_14000 [Blautia sp. AF22-5LB]|nr:hypothetical protein DWX98_14000 [Blautia sp. AF22-5LB]
MRKFGVSDVDRLDGFCRPTKKEKRKPADLRDSDIPKKIVFLISGCAFWSLGYILYMVGRRSCYPGI